MTEAAEWRGVAIRYPLAKRRAVGPLDLKLEAGERVLLLGPSGSGKSSLLLSLTGLIPHSVPAEVEGETFIFGAPAASRPPAEWAASVAHYFQDADRMLCGMRVEDEIAFALENKAVAPQRIGEAVTGVMQRTGLPQAWRGRRSTTLSGGERQLVALAAALAQDAPIFIADEPTAHLSPEASSRLHALLADQGSGRTSLIVDHRLDGLIERIDRVVALDGGGSVIAEGAPRAVFRENRDRLAALGIWRPAAIEADAALGKAGLAPKLPPLAMEEVVRHLERLPGSHIERARPILGSLMAERFAPRGGAAGEVVARLSGAACAPFLGTIVLRGIDLEIREGEVLGILGANGAGKTTLGACLAGVLPLREGKREGKPGGIAFQNPENQFLAASVRDEIALSLPQRLAGAERDRRIGIVLEVWGLSGLEPRHPFELSQGQKRRLSLATLDAADRWKLLVLDEPAAGLDAAGTERLCLHIGSLRDKGYAVALITHDMELAARLCDRLVILGGGRIVAEGPPAGLMRERALLQRAGLAEPCWAPVERWLKAVPAC